MKCTRCSSSGFRLILGGLGVPFFSCNRCSHATYSEIARIVLDNTPNLGGTIETYLSIAERVTKV